MNFPFWDFPYGHGLLIAVVAGVHVFVSHFAIGGGLYLVLSEWRARRNNDRQLLAALVPHSRFFLLLTVVFGALTGVSIWFTIGLISPTLTSALIHIFVWGWAIEWVFFFVEIAAAMLYYYGWSRLDPKTHLRVGVIYFVAAYLSLIAINGIITFMLTPGTWLQTGNFWDGFFNPTYWQSVAARTGICIVLAGMFALLTGTRLKIFRSRVSTVRHAALWVAAGTIMLGPSLYWYITSLPHEIKGLAAGVVPILPQMLQASLWAGALAVALAILGALLIPKRLSWLMVLPLLLLALVSFTSLEWAREAARKPYGIPGYLYANGIGVASLEKIQGQSVSDNMWFSGIPDSDTLAYGKRLFQMQCRTCHSNDLYNGLGPKLNGWQPEHLAQIVDRLKLLRGRMPGFVGDQRDRALLVAHLGQLGSRYPQSEPLTGKQVFHKYCGICHTERAYRPLVASLEGLDLDELGEILDDLQDYSEQMPTFTGSATEREMLIDYILEFASPATIAEENE